MTTYKTAAELGIKEGEHAVLLMAKDWLAKNDQTREYRPIEGNGKFSFFMGRTIDHDYKPEPDCRSQGCIWGLCHVLAAVHEVNAFRTSPYGKNHTYDVSQYGVSVPLDTLFFPHRHNKDISYSGVTPRMAADWIEHWMTTGKFNFEALIY